MTRCDSHPKLFEGSWTRQSWPPPSETMDLLESAYTVLEPYVSESACMNSFTRFVETARGVVILSSSRDQAAVWMGSARAYLCFILAPPWRTLKRGLLLQIT